MTYAESERILNQMQDRDFVLFRMAISHLMDVGIRNLTEENVEECCKEIDQEDDSRHFMTNAYKKEIVKTAAELAKIDHIHLLVYIQRNMTYDVGDGVNMPSMFRSVCNALEDVICSDCYFLDEGGISGRKVFKTLSAADMSNEEIAYIGYGWCLPAGQDEEID